jgi:hypothetical protein
MHDTSPVYCPKCGMLMVRVYTMPNISVMVHGGPTADHVTREKQMGQDRDAYKRLRHSGVQPAGIQNSAFLEKHAETNHEIEMGKICQDKASLRQGVDLAQYVVGKDLEL